MTVAGKGLSNGFVSLLCVASLAACGSDARSKSSPDSGASGDAMSPPPSGGGGAGGGDGSGGQAGGRDAAPDAPQISPDPDYAATENWLCYPGAQTNYCLEDQDATVVAPDGTLTIEPHVVAEDPPFDCFYVYPTVSGDPSIISDLEPDTEINTVQQQAARLNSLCEVYAPLYRQVTLSGIFGNAPPGGPSAAEAREIAYGDVVAAWEHYLAERSGDRGFVLIGHSQGSGHLTRLIREHLDGNDALRSRLIGAYLLGSAVAVPEGEDVGGDFANIPACRSTDQVGCVVSYATFREDQPPPDTSFFGRPRSGDGVALCVNPAAPAGGTATLKPYFSTRDENVISLAGLEPIDTPYVTLPNFFEAECVVRNGFSILELTILADPDDPRPDDIGGNITPDWGLHLLDANVAMGDIVAFVETQWAAYSAP